jgi:hypothetical protein
MNGRKKYQRPQGIVLSSNSGTSVAVNLGTEQSPSISNFYYPTGEEFSDFIILSDDNRQEISFSSERIETRKRMINGRMRSYHIADKLSVSTSWNNLPSRGFSGDPSFDINGVSSLASNSGFRELDEESSITGRSTVLSAQYTSDGGAGGAEILRWYEDNPGSFWVFLSYDKYTNFADDDSRFNNLNKYSQVVEVFFSSFDYSVVKRGGSNYDFWNISFTLEEV